MKHISLLFKECTCLNDFKQYNDINSQLIKSLNGREIHFFIFLIGCYVDIHDTHMVLEYDVLIHIIPIWF